MGHLGGSALELRAMKSVDVGLPAPFGYLASPDAAHHLHGESTVSPPLPLVEARQVGEWGRDWALRSLGLPSAPARAPSGRSALWVESSCRMSPGTASPAHTFARRTPVSARAGGDLEQPLKVSSQLNLIKLQLQEPAAFS